jgi:hypothetical protein
MLVSGHFTPSDLQSFVYLGKGVRRTRRVKQARLYPFTKRGAVVSWRHAEALRKQISPEPARSFLMRVVVTGSLEKPDEVIEAWRLEGANPVRVRYYFD